MSVTLAYENDFNEQLGELVNTNPQDAKIGSSQISRYVTVEIREMERKEAKITLW